MEEKEMKTTRAERLKRLAYGLTGTSSAMWNYKLILSFCLRRFVGFKNCMLQFGRIQSMRRVTVSNLCRHPKDPKLAE